MSIALGITSSGPTPPDASTPRPRRAPAAESEVETSLLAFSYAARVAGLIVAFAYLFGVIAGPVVGIVAALALVTVGRGVVQAPAVSLWAAAGLGLVGCALVVAVLRWSTLDAVALRGAQAVLGPTALVGPTMAATAAWLAVVAATIGLALWLAPGRPPGALAWGLVAAEAVAGALAVALAYAGPGVAFDTASAEIGAIARWLGTTVVVAVAAVALARVRPRVPAWTTWSVFLAAAVVVVVGMGLARAAV